MYTTSEYPTFRVLLIDDCRNSRAIVQHHLRDARIEVLTASGAREGIELVKQGNIDYVFMDIQMPGLDGCAATRAIRYWEHFEGRPALPITALTSFSTREHLESIYAAGCTHYLLKPITRVILLQTLQQHASARPVDLRLTCRVEPSLVPSR